MEREYSNECREGEAMKHEHVDTVLGVFIAVMADDWNDYNGDDKATRHEVSRCDFILTKSCSNPDISIHDNIPDHCHT